MRDGTLTQPSRAVHLPFDFTRELDADTRPEMSEKGQKLRVFWDTSFRKLAFGEDNFDVYELEPGSNRIIARLKWPKRATPRSAFGDPDSGLFMLGWMVARTGAQAIVQYLVLRPAKLSSLPFFFYSDVSRPRQGVLGIALPPGKTLWTVGDTAYTPTTPLALGDPYSGKVRWKNPDFEYGLWIGTNYVVARKSRGSRWYFLDGRTGRPVSGPIPELGTSEGFFVQTSGPYLLLRTVGDPELRCFRITSQTRGGGAGSARATSSISRSDFHVQAVRPPSLLADKALSTSP